jgi:hypothetical protein
VKGLEKRLLKDITSKKRSVEKEENADGEERAVQVDNEEELVGSRNSSKKVRGKRALQDTATQGTKKRMKREVARNQNCRWGA